MTPSSGNLRKGLTVGSGTPSIQPPPMPPSGTTRADPEHGQRTRAIIACQRLTLDRAERQELAEVLTGHEGSWATISEADARRVADAADAFLLIQQLLLLRRTRCPG